MTKHEIIHQDGRINVKEALMNLLNSSNSGGNQFVTFAIGNEEYGISIHSVQEISRLKDITPLPNTPNYILGILNLRGHVIPIIDPRLKFGLSAQEYSKSAVIIIFESLGKTVGMVVDRISDVLTINKENIEDTPTMAMDIDTQFLSGVGRTGERFIIILDVESFFKKNEIKQILKEE